MTYQVAASPWDVVNNPPEDTFVYYGEVNLEVSFFMWAEGQGKVPYDPNYKDSKGRSSRRLTNVDITIVPISESGLKFDLQRSLIVENPEWKKITWPSLRDLGILEAQTIIGKFAKVITVPTGRKYNDKNGVEREATTLQFLALYDTREACAAAWQADFGGSAPAPAPAPTNGANTEQATALKFASALVKNAARKTSNDLVKMREILEVELAKQPVISKYFTVDSPEIVEMMTTEVG